MKKRLSIFLCLLVVAVCVLLPVTADALNSGSTGAAQPTREQIAAKYNELVKIGEVFEERPSTTAPYTLGKLSTSAKQGTLTYLNYIRYIAKLPAVELREDLNTSAQHGAVVNAANDAMSHTPDQPAGMDDSFYQEGYAAASSSNLSCCYGYSESAALTVGVQGCIDDEDPSNADVLGHRRWFLNPSLKYVGVGTAVASGGWQYSAFKVFDRSGSCSYDYVSWPASGNMPAELFAYNVPWSVTLNPSIYNVPNRNSLQITVSGGGNTWVFNGSTPSASNGTAPYMRVDSMSYGVPNCIIFRPDCGSYRKYAGVYTVKITGLTKRDGTAATLEFQVDFFNVDDYKARVDILSHPKTQDAYPGDSITVSVSAKGEDLQYQWYYRNGSSTTKLSATGTSYTQKVDLSHDGGQFYCVITDRYGNTATSNSAYIYVKNPVKLTKQPAAPTVKEGARFTVSVGATGDYLSYRWYYKDTAMSSFREDTTQTSQTYSAYATADMAGRQLFCRVTDTYGNSVDTNKVTVTVQAQLRITKQPVSVKGTSGETKAFSVSATGDGLCYQWYCKNKGASSFSAVKNATGATHNVKLTSAMNGQTLYCKVTDKYGNTENTNQVTLSVQTKLAVTKQPKSVTAASGKYVSLSVSATGDGLRYQWYYKNKGASSFSAVENATSATYKVKLSSSKNGRTLYCRVTDQYGNSVKTQEVKLTVAAKLKLTKQPKSAKVYSGTKIKIAAKATGDGLTYKWYYKDKGAKSYKVDKSVTGSTYNRTATKAMNGRKLYCKITDQYGNTVKTKTVTLTVRVKAKITKQPVSAKVVMGDTAKFTVKANGDGLTYKWYYKDSGMKSYKLIKSAKKSTLKLKLTKARNGRKLFCKVTDKYGNTVKTKTVTLKKKTQGITATFSSVNSKETQNGKLYNVCTLTVKAAKGTAPYQYKYEVFANEDSKNPLISRGYTSARSYGIMSTGSLKKLVIRVTVKDSKGNTTQYRVSPVKAKVLSRKVIK